MKIALDTNILVYVDDSSDPDRRAKAMEVLRLTPAELVVIPVQVLAEYVRVLLRKHGYPPNEVRDLLSIWIDTYDVVETTSSIVLAAADLTTTHSVSFWDAVILSSAAEADCRVLLTEDMDHGFTWSGVTVVNPFATPRHHLLETILTDPSN